MASLQRADDRALVERIRRYDVSSAEWRLEFGCDVREASRRAAVLVALARNRSGDLDVLVTRRAAHLRRSAGEVSLPGGKMEDRDAGEVGTALREAEEEVGLQGKDVHVIGQLPPLATFDGIVVTPVVALLLDGFSVAPNPSEVEAIFYVPIKRFLSRLGHRVYRFPGVFFDSIYFDDEVDGRMFTIWGLTAHMLMIMAAIICNRKPDYPISIVCEAYLAHLRCYFPMLVCSAPSKL